MPQYRAVNTAERKTAALFLALALALFAAVGGDAVADQRVAVTEAQPRFGSGVVKRLPAAPTKQAEISPPLPLCMSARWGNWPDRELRLRWMIAQQADGGRWHHTCTYEQGTYL